MADIYTSVPNTSQYCYSFSGCTFLLNRKKYRKIQRVFILHSSYSPFVCPHSIHCIHLPIPCCFNVSFPCTFEYIETESAKISTNKPKNCTTSMKECVYTVYLLAWTLPVTKNFIQFIYFSFFFPFASLIYSSLFPLSLLSGMFVHI